jgi:hypothetical protein
VEEGDDMSDWILAALRWPYLWVVIVAVGVVTWAYVASQFAGGITELWAYFQAKRQKQRIEAARQAEIEAVLLRLKADHEQRRANERIWREALERDRWPGGGNAA